MILQKNKSQALQQLIKTTKGRAFANYVFFKDEDIAYTDGYVALWVGKLFDNQEYAAIDKKGLKIIEHSGEDFSQHARAIGINMPNIKAVVPDDKEFGNEMTVDIERMIQVLKCFQKLGQKSVRLSNTKEMIKLDTDIGSAVVCLLVKE